MKVSLILATLGRIEDVRIFFESLVNQTYNNVEVIVVDQNVEDVLDDIVEKYSKKITMLKENLWKIIFLNLMIQLKKI